MPRCNSIGDAPSRAWVAGRLRNPPPPGRLAGRRAPGKQPKYVVHHCTASSHAWYGYGDGFARVGGVGHLSRIPLPHTPSCSGEWTASHLGTPTRMGLGHSTSPVLSTHVILLGMPTKSHIFSYLKNACTGASPCMLADISWTRGRYNTMQRQLCW